MKPAGGLRLIAFLALSAQAVAGEAAFERHEIQLGAAARQTVLTGFFSGGEIADIAVLSVGANAERRLQVYAHEDGSWKPTVETTLGAEVRFIDVATLGGRDRLILYQRGRLRWLDPTTGEGADLPAVPCSFVPPRHDEVPHVDVTRDLNGDGRDELVVPAADGFRVSVQQPDGTFTEPVRVGGPVRLQRILGADGYRFEPWEESRVHAIDYDHDGRRDLVFWNRGRFEVQLQSGDGFFSPETVPFTTAVEFDSDEMDDLLTGGHTGRVLHSLSDLSGDGVGDLVVYSLEGRSPSAKRSAFEIHYGERTPTGTTGFSPEADVVFRSDRRIQLALKPIGVAQGGAVGVMITTLEVRHLTGGAWKRLKGLMGDDVRLQLEFYRNDGEGLATRPAAIRNIALDGVPSHREPGWVPLEVVLRGPLHAQRRQDPRWPRAFNRTLLIGDVTGDGRADLLLEPEFRDLRVHVGVPGETMFAERYDDVSASLLDGEYSWLADLNGDEMLDVVLHDPFVQRDVHGGPKPGSEGTQRVTFLIAR